VTKLSQLLHLLLKAEDEAEKRVHAQQFSPFNTTLSVPCFAGF
jgi:hypothetical protein